MDDDEREYWFQILPIMTDEQVENFKKILISEKDQLAKLDAEYEKEIKRINKKHVVEWEAFESLQKTEEIKAAEEKAEIAESSLEEDLLMKLQEL